MICDLLISIVLLTHWLTEWLFHWMTCCQTKCMNNDYLTKYLTVYLTGCQTPSVNQTVNQLIVQSFNQLQMWVILSELLFHWMIAFTDSKLFDWWATCKKPGITRYSFLIEFEKVKSFKYLGSLFIFQLVYLCFCPAVCPSQETEVTSTPTRPVDNVIATKGLQDRNINILAGTTVENKGKLILTNHLVDTILH